jgi:hypothetical protein
VRRRRGRAAQLGKREEVALVGGEVHLAAELVLLGRLDLLGDERDVARLELADLGLELGGVERTDVELDDAREVEQPLHLGRVDEVVERQREAGVDGLLEHPDQRIVDELVLDELDHRAVRLERQRADVEEEVARDVDVRPPVADQQVEPEVGERGGQHAGRRRLRGDGLRVVRHRAIQQLIRDHVPAGVEDRLAGDDD